MPVMKESPVLPQARSASTGLRPATLLALMLLCAPAWASATDEAPHRFELRDGAPRVVWARDNSGFDLAPGYPKLASGGSVTAQDAESVYFRYAPLPPGASMVLLFTSHDTFPGPDGPAYTVEYTISESGAKVRKVYNNRSRALKEQYDFSFTFGPPPPQALEPGDSFTITGQGAASTEVKQPSYDSKAVAGLSLSDSIGENPSIKGFAVGHLDNAWKAAGNGTNAGVIEEPKEGSLDYGHISYQLNAGPQLELDYSYTREPRAAVVFLPGVAGTALFSSTSIARFEVWPTASISNRAAMGLNPDGTTANKDTYIKLGDILRSFPTNYYGALVDFLGKKHYELNKDLFLFPYDWRMDNQTHFERLDELIEKAAKLPGKEGEAGKERKVVLVAHSMGGVISRAYLLSSEKRRKRVKTLVTFATPYFGAPKVFYGFIDGYGFGNPTVAQELMKVLIQNWPAAYQLLPWEPFVRDGGKVLSLDETYRVKYHGYTGIEPGFLGDTYVPAEGTPWFMHPLPLGVARAFWARQGSKASPEVIPGVRHEVIIGTGVKTLTSYEMRDALPLEDGLRLGARHVVFEPVFLDGDGTVPLWSLEIPGATHTYYVPYINPNALGTGLRDVSSAHAAVPGNPKALEIFGRILEGKPPESSEYAYHPELIDVEAGIELTLHSHAQMSVEGEGGRLGYNKDGGIDETLPTGTFLGTASGEYAAVGDTERPVTAVINGTSHGTFTLQVSITRAGTNTRYSYPDVEVEKGTGARVQVDPRTPAAMPTLAVTTAGVTRQVPAKPGVAGQAPRPPTPPAAPPPVAAAAPVVEAPPPKPAAPPPSPPPSSPSSPPSAPPPIAAHTTAGRGIHIIGATYGGNCSVKRGNASDTLRQACDGRDHCDYVIDYTVIGDPAPGCQKDYAAQWSCNGLMMPAASAAPEAGFGSHLLLDCGAAAPPTAPVVIATPPPKPATPTPPPPPPLAAHTPPETPGRGIHIIGATYGGNCGVKRGNASDTLRAACDGRDRCEYVIDYTVIGDPAPGCQKDYAVQWSCNNLMMPAASAAPEAGFGSHLLLDCGAVAQTAPPPPVTAPAGAIRVVAGTYGGNCGVAHGKFTDPLRQACEGRAQCDYVVDYRVIGDPAYGCQKDFVAEWNCGGGELRSSRAPAEAGFGSHVLLECPGAHR